MKKILIVEDQTDIREVIRITLELDPVELREATDGHDGLSQALQWKPDLVLSDVMMPGLDGLQLCRRIKSELALGHTRVALLSARGQSVDRAAGRGAGADAYIVKPYSPLELLETVRRLLH